MSEGENKGGDLMQRIASAGARIDPGLSDRDVERLVSGARRRRHRGFSTRRVLVAAGAAAALALVLGVAMSHRAPRPRAPEVAAAPRPAPASRVLRLSDGSTAAPLDAQTDIELLEERPDRVRLSLARGRARFEVTPQPKRAFMVRAGDVTVVVVGTVFTVERVADRVGVAVQRGTVRVEWADGAALVNAGQSGWYPPLAAAVPSSHARRNRTASPAAAAPAVRDEKEAAAELLLAADRARLAGRGEDGAELLRRLLREYPDDPRAPLAAFTLGRLLLMELGRPGEAAAAFAETRRLAPQGPFAEDALAREVEALGKAGRSAEAQARAQEYQRLYPNGRRTATVRAAGGNR